MKRKLKIVVVLCIEIGILYLIYNQLDTHNHREKKFVQKINRLNVTNTNKEHVTLPDVMPGEPNMPDVLFQSVRFLKEKFGKNHMNLAKDSLMCSNQITCRAFVYLLAKLGPRQIDLNDYIFHLNILRNRLLPITPRPFVCKSCMAFNFKTIIPAEVCKKGDKIDLVILITTVPSAVEARRALRGTWLRHSKNNTANVRYVFLIGAGWSEQTMKKLRTEHEMYKDFLVEDYIDSYYNLSYKVHSGYRWAVKHCPQAEFVSRSADDIYMHLPRILDYISNVKNSLKDTFVGTCDTSSGRPPPWSKLYVTYNDFPGKNLGPFCHGKSLILPINAAKEWISKAPDVPWFPLEDHWVGMVGLKAGLKVKYVKQFNVEYYPTHNIEQYIKDHPKRKPCVSMKDWFSIHRVKPSDIWEIHAKCL